MREALVVVALLLSACAVPSEAPQPPAGPSASPTRQITAQGQFEVTLLSNGADARHVCWAAAQSRNANWTGLVWTPHQPGEITCALAPRRHNVVEAPSMESEGCFGNLCNELPLRLATNGTRPAAIHANPDETSRIIGEISPGEHVTVFDRMFIRTFSHRGIVRRATTSLAAGDVVFPLDLSDEPFPWRPRPPGPDETGYEVRTVPYAVIDFVPIDANDPYVEWTPLAPLKGNVSWVLLEDSEGVRGWVADSALGIDFQEPDEYE